MKLIELIEKYKGNPILFDVNGITEDGNADIAKFTNTEYKAIKDNILNSEVSKYTVSVSNTVPAKPAIEVVLKAILSEENSEHGGESSTPTAPSTPGTDSRGEEGAGGSTTE